MLKSKANLKILYFSQLFASFSFFGLISILILILTQNIGFAPKLAYLIFGNFVALNYIAAFVGGVIGSSFLSFEFTCLYGFLCMSIGSFLLIYHGQGSSLPLNWMWALGFVMIAGGNGLIEPNIRNLLGTYYKDESENSRDHGFTMLHVYNIIGQASGILIMPLLNLWSDSLIFASIFTVCILGIINSYLVAKKKSFSITTIINKGWLAVFSLLSCMFIIMVNLKAKSVLEVILSSIIILTLYFFIFKEKDKKIKIISLLIVLIAMTMVEICFRQLMGTITLFTNVYVNRSLIGFTIPASMFESLDPIFILMIFIPILNLRNKMEERNIKTTSGTLMSFGLFLLALAFSVLYFASLFQTAKVGIAWVVLFYAILAVGELFTIPIATAAITAISPIAWRGIMMGIFELTASFSSYIDSWIGQLISPASGNPTFETYHQFFLNMTIFAVAASIVLFVGWTQFYSRYKKKIYENM